MKKHLIRTLTIFSLSLFSGICLFPEYGFSDEIYTVDITGCISTELNEQLRQSSQLIILQESPPLTITGLQRRVDSDVEDLLSVLHSEAYFSAVVTPTVVTEGSPVQITIDIDAGPQYPIEKFEIISNNPQGPIPSLDEIGIEIGSAAYPKTILDAEEKLLNVWQEAGYPFAKIEKAEVKADLTSEIVTVVLTLESGPKATFGPTYINGNETVELPVFNKKISWRVGEPYSLCRIEETRHALDSTRLFREITITPANELAEDGSLPMTITVDEGKHRSIGFGVSYATSLGPGVSAEWENRNFRGMGETITFTTDLWYSLQKMRLLYAKPDFMRKNQTLFWLAELEHEKTKGFTESNFSISGNIERQLTPKLQFSYGGMYKALKSEDSDNDGDFNLFKTPLQLRWINTDDLLNPTTGETLTIKVTPTAQIFNEPFGYVINTAVGTTYLPLLKSKRQILAVRAILGSIVGSSRHEIPPPERFYAGSDATLRGYHYLTVSPINNENKPIGGRSMMIFSIEPRFRIGENLGFVLFYDIGNVYRMTFPTVNHKQLQSAGIGFRYHTPIGPLRLDFAVPLNPRKKLDGPVQIYFSVGQAF